MKERSLFANSAWGVLSNLFRVVIGFIFIPLVIYKLNTTTYGLFTILMLFTYSQGIISQVDLGYFGYLVKDISKHTGNKAFEEFNLKSAGFNSFLIVFQIFLYLLILMFIDPVSNAVNVPPENKITFVDCIKLILISNLFTTIGSIYSTFLMAQHHNAFIKKVETVFYLLFNLFAIGGLYFYNSIYTLILAFALTQIFQSFVFVFVVYRLQKKFFEFGLFKFSEIKLRWVSWKPFFFAKLNGLAFRQTDTALVTFFLGPQYVTFYDLSMKIPSFLKATLGKISESFISFSGARQSKDDQKQIASILSDLLFLKIAIALILFASSLFYADKILYAWLGQKIDASLFLGLKISSLLPVFVAFCSVPAALFLGRESRSNFMTWVPTCISLGNLIASIPLTYFYGFTGTIIATVFQYVAYALILAKPMQDDFGFSVMSLLKKLSIFFILILPFQYVISLFLKGIENQKVLVFALVGCNALFGLALLYIYKNELNSLRKRMAIRASQKNMGAVT